MKAHFSHLVSTLCHFVVGSAALLLFSSAAHAEDSTQRAEPTGFAVQEFRIGVGVSAERWAEEAIATIYDKNGKWFPTLSMSYRFHKHMSIDTSAGAGRLVTADERNEIQFLPVTVGASLLFGDRNREPFVSVAAGLVQFSEKLMPYYTSDYPIMTYGTKLGVDTKAGVRIGTSLLPHSTQHPRQVSGPSQLDIEIAMGYRVHQAFGLGTGLNLNAFHSSVGVNLRF